jgi:hypothetical protein
MESYLLVKISVLILVKSTIELFIQHKDLLIDGEYQFKVLVHSVCQWKIMKEAIESIVFGNKTKDINSKAEFFGKFYGRLINLLGSNIK